MDIKYKMMRIYVFFCILLLNLSITSAENVLSQVTKETNINLSYANSSIVAIIEDLGKQTEYSFVYDESLLNQYNNVTIRVKNATLTQVLDLINNQTKISFHKAGDTYTVIPPFPAGAGKTSQQTTVGAQQGMRITGTVSDNFGELLPGVNVTVRGIAASGTSTDVNGEFSLTVPSDTCVLLFRYIGYKTQEIPVGSRRIFAVTLLEETEQLEEVVVVAFGKQKKESLVSSIQSVNTKELHIPSSNLTTAFAGRIAGMISYQTSGEPGLDNASFFIRGVTSFGTGKVDPLILVDNVEVSSNDLANLHPDDLASFSILKDAPATALYGARGANGVILISTKEGNEGAPKINVRVETSLSQPTSLIEMADPISYMYLCNEAITTRDPMLAPRYGEYKIFHTINKTNPYVYPMVDWMKMLVKPSTINERANLNISGGGNIARYYVAGSFSRDNGILKVDNKNNFNNNINSNKYLLHSNININLTKSTEMIVRLHGTFNDYHGPVTGGSALYQRIMQVSPVDFPAYYEPVGVFNNVSHILFGGERAGDFFLLNPYAEMLKGFSQKSNSTMMAQFELKQNFGKWVEGLSGRVMGNTQRYGAFDLTMQYSPFYYRIGYHDRINNTYSLFETNPESGTEYLQYYPGNKTINYSLYGEGALNYIRTFGEKHDVSGMFVGIVRQYHSANESQLVNALVQRNLGLSGRFTYGYDSRYFTEINFGYNGSEKFDKGHRWGFFPSIGLGWNVTNESFFPEVLKKKVSKLKIRGTYGLVGNDEISSQRFFYISEVQPSGGDYFVTGIDFNGIGQNGYRINNYPNPNITWEISQKSNLGIELGLFNGKLEILTDIFREHRTNILQSRVDIPTEQGLWSTPLVNIGEALGKGVDISFDYQQTVNKDLWFVGRANFTYARSTYLYYEESAWDMLGVPQKSHKGRSVNQKWGYVADHLFIDEAEIEASARQDFSLYQPGDIKYKDINGDGVIDLLDQAPIGYPTMPEINYGFGLSAGYKGFDFSFFFSGSARSSFFIDPGAMEPFLQRTVNNDGNITTNLSSGNARMNGGLAKFIADDYWSEQSQNPYAGWPRFSYLPLSNNTQTSTWWMYDGRFLRLKSAEMGYSMPNRLVSKLGLSSLRVYLSGTNLLLFSKFKLWDVELGGNGLNYPLQRVYNLGINLSF